MGRFEDYLDRAMVDLSISEPFYAHILYGVRVELVEDATHHTKHKTAYTDCLTGIWFYKEFVDRITYREFVFVLKHELDHIIRLTNARRDGRDPEGWNIASDYAINNDMVVVKRDDPYYYDYFEVLKGALVSRAYEGMIAEEIYENSPSPKGGNSFDDIIEPEEGLDLEAKEAEVIDKVLDACDKIGDDYGNLSSGLRRTIESYKKAKLDWKSILSEFVSRFPTDYDFTRRDRRFGDIFIPDIGGETVEIAVGVDMSGSISQAIASDFLSECYGILTAYSKVKLMAFTFDTDILHTGEVETKTDLDDFVKGMKGGGGTSFVSPILKVQKRSEIQALVMLTDGMGAYPPKDKVTIPILWVVTKGGTIKEGYGKVAEL